MSNYNRTVANVVNLLIWKETVITTAWIGMKKVHNIVAMKESMNKGIKVICENI